MDECFEVLMFMAAKNLQLSLFEKGELYAQTALSLQPESQDARVFLAYAQLLNQRFEEALSTLEPVSKETKNVHYVRARAFMLMGNSDASKQSWQQYVRAEK